MSRIKTVQHIRKPLFVDAVRVTKDNLADVAAWCQGGVCSEGADYIKAPGTEYVHVRVHNPKYPRQTRAFVGDWILYTDRGYKVYTNKAFRASFDEAASGTEEQTTPEFPREEGDTIVIGPQCFAALDGSVLNWRGVNYVPQSESDDITLMGGEVVKAA